MGERLRRVTHRDDHPGASSDGSATICGSSFALGETPEAMRRFVRLSGNLIGCEERKKVSWTPIPEIQDVCFSHDSGVDRLVTRRYLQGR